MSAISRDQFASETYKIIEKNAESNTIIQGVASIAGFPYTLVANGTVLITHYRPMLNEIRALNGMPPVDVDMLKPMISSILKGMMRDLLADQVLGFIPFAGAHFNAICARAMTWRMGILFAMLTAKNENIATASTEELANQIRETFPQKDLMTFLKPEYAIYERLITEV